ncbi:MAG: IclR family transcriptional regulator [Anaerolineae bacterium]|nr:IclR family transcriptional regulator [Anaerolineae bacterium]
MAGTQSIQRAVAMLEAFTDERPSWNVSDLAEAVGLNRTTAYRLLTALESAEYVVRDPVTDDYRLGSGLIVLGARAARANSIRAIALRELEALALETGETATLEILSDRHMVIIEEILGEYVTSGSQHIGSRWPAYATSTGKAILAQMMPDELDAVLPKPLLPLTKRTIISPDLLYEHLAEIRHRGYAVSAEELEMGYLAVGAVVLGSSGRPVAAISLGGTLTRMTDERVPEIGEQVRAAAERISHRLGYRR